MQKECNSKYKSYLFPFGALFPVNSMALLLDSDTDSDSGGFKINKYYASKYDKWRRKEELQTLKDKYRDEDSDSESTDEEVNPAAEKEFLKTLACLKKKDPKIYDSSVSFFEGIDVENKKKTKKEKPIYLKDLERHQLLQNNGDLNYDDDEEENSIDDVERHRKPLSKAREEEEIKKSFKKAMEENESDDDDLLIEKPQTKEEKDKARADYIDWLQGNKNDTEDVEAKSEMKDLHDYWNNPSLDKNEEFLKNYILNRKYLIKEEDEDDTFVAKLDVEDLTDDENMIDKQAAFEQKYNFRFEEPDKEFIKHYPRIIDDSLRRKDERRKNKREETKFRKMQEKEQKKEELKQLKALKRKEIMDKLKRLQEITGNSNNCFDGEFLEGEFNPEKHEKKMREIFDEQYYNEVEEEKPEFQDYDDDDCEAENWDDWDVEKTEQHLPHCEDPDFNMDADYDPRTSRDAKPNEVQKGKKNKRKSKLVEVLSFKKPRFDETDKTYEEYIEEYYKLDYEDVIGGDLPCRFKYRKVVPNDFGLSVEEILQADDKELNQWCSLKKTVRYRNKKDEEYDVHAYKIKGKNFDKKKKILASIYQKPENDEDIAEETSNLLSEQHDLEASTSSKQQKRRNKKEKAKKTGLSDERLRAYGINPKKYKNKLKYGNK